MLHVTVTLGQNISGAKHGRHKLIYCTERGGKCGYADV